MHIALQDTRHTKQCTVHTAHTILNTVQGILPIPYCTLYRHLWIEQYGSVQNRYSIDIRNSTVLYSTLSNQHPRAGSY